MKYRVCTLLLALIFLQLSCRGWTTDKPPIHVNPNMDTQHKYKPYKESDFFQDKRTMRPVVEGTVSREGLKEDDAFYRGKSGDVSLKSYPGSLQIDKAFLMRGQDRYHIYCAPCHSEVADGRGLVGRRMAIKPSNLHSEYFRSLPVGHFFDVISNGIRTMPAYKNIPEMDRWAIVAYVRALQLSQAPDAKWLNDR